MILAFILSYCGVTAKVVVHTQVTVEKRSVIVTNMNYFQFTKRTMGALLLGFLIIVALVFVTSGFALFIIPSFLSHMTILKVLSYGFGILTLITPVIGGFVVGWRIRERGWLYGGLLGLILSVISMLVVSLTFILPASVVSGPNFSIEQARFLAKANLMMQLTHAPFLIAVTALGGVLGVWAYRKRQKSPNSSQETTFTESPSTP